MVLSDLCPIVAAAARRPDRRHRAGASTVEQLMLGQPFRRGLRSYQVRREAWSAMFVIFGLVDMGFPMTINSAPPGGPPEARLGAPTVVSAAPASWPWRR